MALNSQDTNVSALVINKCTKDQYDAMESHSASELYVVPEDIDIVPTLGSMNPVSSSGVKGELDTKVTKSGDTMTGKLTLQKAFNQLITGSGTAATDKGEGVANRYVPAKWTFNTGSNAVNGDIFTIKIPVAGHSYGVYMSVNNGTNYYPVVTTTTGRLQTQYAASVSVMVMFDSSGSCTDIFPLNGGDARSTVSGGVFRVINYYDSNTDVRPSAYCDTAAGTAAKVASCTGYALLNKSFLHVVIVNSNTSASALTLNVNGKGAKAIYINGSASSSSNYSLPAGSYIVYYADSKYYFQTNGYFPARGGVVSLDKYISSYNASTWVGGLTNACLTVTGTTYDSWVCGPTRNGNISISTHPASGDVLYFGYGEKGRTNNSFAHQMTWTGSTGGLALDGVPVCTRAADGNLSDGNVMIWDATTKKLVGMPIQPIATADSTHQGLAESSDVANYINKLQSQITILKQENKILKSYHSAQITEMATFKSLVPNTATSIVFDFKSNQSTTGYTLAGYIDDNNEIEVWNNSTNYLVLSNKIISAPTSCEDMFSFYQSLTSLDFSNFDTANTTSFVGMFYRCSSLTALDLSNFDTTNSTEFVFMFYGCSGLTSLDLSNFDTTNATDFFGMFSDCSGLTTIIANDWSASVSSDDMFYGCTSLVGGNGTTYNSSHTDASYAHIDVADNPGYFTAPTT